MDQLVEETITTLHPDTLVTTQATMALRRLMEHYAGQHPAAYWAGIVSNPLWRHNRPAVIRAVAEREWLRDTCEQMALQCAELMVMAAEAIAGRWEPEQCRVMAVRIDGEVRISFVCSMEGYAA